MRSKRALGKSQFMSAKGQAVLAIMLDEPVIIRAPGKGVHKERRRSKKMRVADAILEAGDFVIPSPDEIEASSFNAVTLARWGVKWPPRAGWRRRLENRWYGLQTIKKAQSSELFGDLDE